VFTSRSGAAHRAALTVSRCAGRRHRPGVAPEPGPAGHAPATSHRPRFAGPPGHRSAGPAAGFNPWAAVLPGTRTREVTPLHGMRRPAYAADPAHLPSHPTSPRGCPQRCCCIHSRAVRASGAAAATAPSRHAHAARSG